MTEEMVTPAKLSASDQIVIGAEKRMITNEKLSEIMTRLSPKTIARVPLIEYEKTLYPTCQTHDTLSPSTKHPTDVREELLQTHGSRAEREC